LLLRSFPSERVVLPGSFELLSLFLIVVSSGFLDPLETVPELVLVFGSNHVLPLEVRVNLFSLLGSFGLSWAKVKLLGRRRIPPPLISVSRILATTAVGRMSISGAIISVLTSVPSLGRRATASLITVVPVSGISSRASPVVRAVTSIAPFRASTAGVVAAGTVLARAMSTRTITARAVMFLRASSAVASFPISSVSLRTVVGGALLAIRAFYGRAVFLRARISRWAIWGTLQLGLAIFRRSSWRATFH